MRLHFLSLLANPSRMAKKFTLPYGMESKKLSSLCGFMNAFLSIAASDSDPDRDGRKARYADDRTANPGLRE